MPTLKQEKAVELLVENGGNVSKSMRQAGYSQETAKTPKKLTESKGFEKLCKKYGLTPKLIMESLVEDIKKKPGNRKPELELGAKILNITKDKVEIDNPNEVKVIQQQNDKIDQLIEEVKRKRD